MAKISVTIGTMYSRRPFTTSPPAGRYSFENWASGSSTRNRPLLSIGSYGEPASITFTTVALTFGGSPSCELMSCVVVLCPVTEAASTPQLHTANIAPNPTYTRAGRLYQAIFLDHATAQMIARFSENDRPPARRPLQHLHEAARTENGAAIAHMQRPVGCTHQQQAVRGLLQILLRTQQLRIVEVKVNIDHDRPYRGLIVHGGNDLAERLRQRL
uniref:Uncharacterized protein n=1 Tax=Anopheles farauti TaxID=69004 RepID=A0A182QD66_9DIPT